MTNGQANANSVLVPLDGSALSDAILAHVERLVGEEPREVLLLRVLAVATDDEAKLERARAEAHLATARARLEAVGARVTTLVRDGDPAAEILAVVAERAPALVAMSSHGRSGVLRWVRGSVAERVLRGCATPLLLVTPNAGPSAAERRFRKILVPLDGSPRSAAILPVVEAVARRENGEVILLRVEWEGTRRPTLAAALSPARVAESLRPWVEQLTARGVRCRAVAAQGDFASEVLDTAEREDVDLIAMATHGRTGLPRLLDGSVSEQVLRHCRRPLLVVRADD